MKKSKKYALMIGSTPHVLSAPTKKEAIRKFKEKYHTTKIKSKDVYLYQ